MYRKKYRGGGASSRRIVQRIGFMFVFFFVGGATQVQSFARSIHHRLPLLLRSGFRFENTIIPLPGIKIKCRYAPCFFWISFGSHCSEKSSSFCGGETDNNIYLYTWKSLGIHTWKVLFCSDSADTIKTLNDAPGDEGCTSRSRYSSTGDQRAVSYQVPCTLRRASPIRPAS